MSALIKTVAVLVAGLGVAFAVNRIWPFLEIVAFFIAFFVVVGVAGVLQAIVERRWVFWTALPSVALLGLAVVMLGSDLALLASGRPTAVVVTDHQVEKHRGANGTTTTHYYKLRRADGRPVRRTMEYAGSSGWDGAKEGEKIIVLLDPAGRAPIRPAASADPGADIGIGVVGLLAVSAVLTACFVSVRREARRDH